MNHLDNVTLNLYLDDALDESARARVEEHLAECETCQREVASLRAVFASFDSWRAEPIPQDLTPHVLTRIARRPSPALISRGGVVLLGAQLAAAILILMWVLPLLMPSLISAVNGLPTLSLSVLNLNPFARVSAQIDSFTLPFPSVALWVWVVAIVLVAVAWLVGNRLILGTVERTEASQ